MFFKKISPRTPSQRNLIQIINIFSKNKPLLKNQIKGSKIQQEEIIQEKLQFLIEVVVIKKNIEKYNLKEIKIQ